MKFFTILSVIALTLFLGTNANPKGKLAKAVATKVGAQLAMEMAFGGVGEVFGTADKMARNRDEIVEKAALAKEKFKARITKKVDHTFNPHKNMPFFDPSAA